jgi:hypothetical protein
MPSLAPFGKAVSQEKILSSDLVYYLNLLSQGWKVITFYGRHHDFLAHLTEGSCELLPSVGVRPMLNYVPRQLEAFMAPGSHVG